MKLTAENTAIVLDSTADFPDAPERYPELPGRAALRALRRRELQGLRRDRPAALLRAAGHRDRAADDVAADARRLPRGLRGARAVVRAHPVAADLVDALRHVRERAERRRAARRRHGARDRHEDRLGGARAARDRRAAAPRARHDRRGDRRVRRDLRASSPLAVHRQHARVPREGRSHRQGGRVRRQPAEREADPHHPRRRGGAVEARPREPEGVRRVQEPLRIDVDRLAEPQGRHRSRRRAGTDGGAAQARARRAAAGGDRDGDHARCRRRDARRSWHRGALLVRRPDSSADTDLRTQGARRPRRRRPTRRSTRSSSSRSAARKGRTT